MVTASRARVLRAYRRAREEGATPGIAMILVHQEFMAQQLAARSDKDEKTWAEANWDCFYATRYFKTIMVRAVKSPYWMGRVVTV